MKKGYFDAFYDKEEICMNTCKTFKELENEDPVIGDICEGISMYASYGFEIELIRLVDNSSCGIFPINNLCLYEDNNNYNILSLYSISDNDFDNDGVHEIPLKFIKEFKDYRF